MAGKSRFFGYTPRRGWDPLLSVEMIIQSPWHFILQPLKSNMPFPLIFLPWHTFLNTAHIGTFCKGSPLRPNLQFLLVVKHPDANFDYFLTIFLGALFPSGGFVLGIFLG